MKNNRGPAENSPLGGTVGRKARRRMKAARDSRPVWFGLGMMGIIGWSVALPTLVGTAAGLWLDAKYPGGHSWTLALLVAGLLIGCAVAWHWVAGENREIGGSDDSG